MPARFVRFTVLATSGVEPCIDELEVFTAGDKPSRTWRWPAPARTATASSVYAGGTNKIHRLEHVNDGRYGNGRSWISAEAGAGWVQIELAEPAVIDRVVWARDREGKFKDRLATGYQIDVSDDGEHWQTVATATIDRQPYDPAATAPQRTAGLPPDVGQQVEQLEQRRQQLRDASAKLAPAMAYLGTFKQPEATHVCYRGDPMQQREPVPPGVIEAVGQAVVAAGLMRPKPNGGWRWPAGSAARRIRCRLA